MREPIRNFRHRRLGGLCPVFSCSVSVMFYLCYSRCPLHAFDACFMLAAFFMILLCFISVLQSRVFQKKIFFPAISSSLFWRVRFSPCGDRGRSLFNVPRGGLSLGALFPHTIFAHPCFHRPRLGSFPRFKRPNTIPSPLHAIPT